jgi:hypothetical protein
MDRIVDSSLGGELIVEGRVIRDGGPVNHATDPIVILQYWRFSQRCAAQLLEFALCQQLTRYSAQYTR